MYEQNEVNIAFEILLEEIENVVEALDEESKESFKLRDYEKTKDLIETVIKLTDFREKVKNFPREWQTLE